MKKALFFLFAITFSALYGQVSMQVTPNSAVLENKHLKAVFSNPGGRMTQLIDKATGKDLVLFSSSDSTGACKDHIPVIDYSFRQSDYAFTVLKNTPGECTFRVTSNNRKMLFDLRKRNGYFSFDIKPSPKAQIFFIRYMGGTLRFLTIPNLLNVNYSKLIVPAKAVK